MAVIPEGDGEKGQAARYQVKWSPAEIVELVKGWPDKTEPLPATRADWEAKAKAFNAKQRAFWAAYNVQGEPAPGLAGTVAGPGIRPRPPATPPSVQPLSQLRSYERRY